MSLKVDYDKVPYNLKVTHELIQFRDFIDNYEFKVNEMPFHTKELKQRRDSNFKKVEELKTQYKAFADMLWENIHLIETIVSNDEEKLKKLREQYEKCRNNTNTLRDGPVV